MRILIDTNIFIYREDYRELPAHLDELMRVLNIQKATLLIHPLSVEELARDSDVRRRAVALSKSKAYPPLECPPKPYKDRDFIALTGAPSNTHDRTDIALLYAVKRDAVAFLITEDKRLLKKAERAGLAKRVLSIDDALDLFGKDLVNRRVARPPALQYDFAYNLDLEDPFFYTLKEEYNREHPEEFEQWFSNISKEGRRCWVYLMDDGGIGALLILKDEEEVIDDAVPPLPRHRRLKLCTFKVTHHGYRIGELFLRISMDYALKNGISELYLTHFIKPDDTLVKLIEQYGFQDSSKKRNGESIYLKKLFPDTENAASLDPSELGKKLYPLFYDGACVNKFIVPILPSFHQRLFTDYRGRQTTLGEHSGEFIVEGNAITKAYLCRAKSKEIAQGDILLFYRSRDKELTSVGVVENVLYDLTDPDLILEHVSRRTVYSVNEIKVIAEKPTTVILFTWHCHLKPPLSLAELNKRKIVKTWPQSIMKIKHDAYLAIKGQGNIDGRITFD